VLPPAQAPLPDVPTEVPEIERSRRIRCVAESCKDILLSKKIYVGNLPFTITEGELRTLFEPYGAVDRINVITDRETGRPRGFAFVEMTDGTQADSATRGLDGKDVGGRALRVNEATDRAGADGNRSSRL
jgi:RNA recognition motif-containing protein